MYANGKMRPVVSIPVIGGRGIQEDDGGSEFKCHVL
jgi:hypothetical protein